MSVFFVMMKNLTLLFFFIGISNLLSSQEKRVEINGVVINPLSKAIKNSNILNLSTKRGAVSNNEGSFTIRAQKGDWIQITNIQYQTKRIRITQGVIKAHFLRVYLLPIINVLDEVEIKKK
jgi:translation initiation factor IF-1